MYLRIFFGCSGQPSQILQAKKEVETKKRKCYGDYDEFKRSEIVKWALVNGNQPAAAKFGVPESTVRSIVKAYNKEKSVKYEEESNRYYQVKLMQK